MKTGNILYYFILFCFGFIFTGINIFLFQKELVLKNYYRNEDEVVISEGNFIKGRIDDEGYIKFAINDTLLDDILDELENPNHSELLNIFTEDEIGYDLYESDHKKNITIYEDIKNKIHKDRVIQKYQLLRNLKPNFFERHITKNDGKHVSEAKFTIFNKLYDSENMGNKNSANFLEEMDEDERKKYLEGVRNKTPLELILETLFIEDITIEDSKYRHHPAVSSLINQVFDDLSSVYFNLDDIEPPLKEKILIPQININFAQEKYTSFYIFRDMDQIIDEFDSILVDEYYDASFPNEIERVIQHFVCLKQIRECNHDLNDLNDLKCRKSLQKMVIYQLDRCSGELNGIEDNLYKKGCEDSVCENIGISSFEYKKTCEEYVKIENKGTRDKPNHNERPNLYFENLYVKLNGRRNVFVGIHS